MNTLAPPFLLTRPALSQQLRREPPRATHRYASLTARDIPPADLAALADLYAAAMLRILGGT